ncbi:MAG: hypothetical protein P6D49_06365 [Acidimicrobiales bacterium]|nr:hypothetical protein [Acidimicrobiales bacterium]
MHDPPTPAELDPLDELASAIVDGEAILPADADPALVDRVAALRNVRAAVAGAVDPPSDAVREAGMAAALGASSTSPDVHSLTMRRRRMPVLPTAAVAAALALLVGLGILSLGDDTRETDVAGITTTAPAAEQHSPDSPSPTTTAAAATTSTHAPVPTLAPVPTEAPTTTFTAATTTAAFMRSADETTITADEIADASGAGEMGAGVLQAGDDTEDLRSPAVQEQVVAEDGFSDAAGGESYLTDDDSRAMPALDDSSTGTAAMSAEYAEIDPFSFLFPYAEEEAQSYRWELDETTTDPPHIAEVPFDLHGCTPELALLLSGEDRFAYSLLFFDLGDRVIEALLVIGHDTWELMLTDTCATFRYPPSDDG